MTKHDGICSCSQVRPGGWPEMVAMKTTAFQSPTGLQAGRETVKASERTAKIQLEKLSVRMAGRLRCVFSINLFELAHPAVKFGCW